MKKESPFNHQNIARQSGFSLFEVLLAMFISAVAVASVMALHARTIAQVNDNANLMRAQRVLDNAAARSAVGVNTQTAMAAEAVQQGMRDVVAVDVPQVINGQNGRRLSIRWQSHDAQEVVWRCANAAVANASCLEMWVLP